MTKPAKVLIIGSGPIVIGQAAEFDYSGSQACRSLREEGVHTVLVNSNPATIMTDEGIADTVYIEPLTVEVIARIIEPGRRHRPHPGRAGADRARRPRRLAHPPGAGRALPSGLEGDRVRGHARRRRQLHHRLQYGEPGPHGRPPR